MREYKTQMEAARKGIVTEELKKVAQKEHLRVEELMPLVAAGKVAICANKNHKCLDPQGVGSMLRTKINVNLGVSRDWKDYDIEMQKVMAAVDMGADAIMDLSSHGDTTGFRRKLTSECPAMIGTVPVYDSVIHYQRDLATLTAKDFIDVVRLHAEDGVDFVTLHCGITRKTIDQIKNHKRKMNIVSRGGSLVFAWMTMTGEENPFYEYYDEILDICREYDVTISLGDACRPGCLADASDVCQIEELVRLGELTKRAWEKDVQVMVEGPGHMPMDQIAMRMCCAIGPADIGRVRNAPHTLSQDEFTAYTNAVTLLKNVPMLINDTSRPSIANVRESMRKMKHQYGSIGAVFIDYLQIMKTTKQFAREDLKIAYFTGELKALAKQYNCVVVLLSQLNRDLEKRPNKRPMCSDLRESGAIEQDADIVMFLYREDYYDKDTDKKNQTEVIIAKHRNGPVDTVRLYFQKEYTKFRDMIQE